MTKKKKKKGISTLLYTILFVIVNKAKPVQICTYCIERTVH